MPGEGVLNKEHFIGTPSSPLWGTSPARGEVDDGFTLIELLVMVLIIGILAAVAVPQYQKAVDKSQYSAMIPYVHALYNAQEIYYLANGHFAQWDSENDSLDIDFPQGTSPVDKYGRPTINHIKLESSGTGSSVGYYLDNNNKEIASYALYSPRAVSSVSGYAGKKMFLLWRLCGKRRAYL